MSERDVYLRDMNSLRDDAALDRVLDDKARANDAPIALLVDDLRRTYPMKEIEAEIERSHVAAILTAASAQREAAAAIAIRPASSLARVRSSFATRVAALVAAATTCFAGAAFAGELPPSVQAAISDTAELIGIDLPHPDDVSADEQPPKEGDALGSSNETDASWAREPRDGREGSGRTGVSSGPRESRDPEADDASISGAGPEEGDGRESGLSGSEDGETPEAVGRDSGTEGGSREEEDAEESRENDGDEEDDPEESGTAPEWEGDHDPGGSDDSEEEEVGNSELEADSPLDE